MMGRARTHGVLVRLTLAEVRAVRRAARDAGHTVAAFVRDAIAREVERCRKPKS